MGDKHLKLKFWGTRGSNPSAAQNMSTYGGETTCVELRTSKNDLVIFDMNKTVFVDKNKMHSKSKNTPFNGIKLKGKVIRTILKGKTVYSSN